MCGENIIFVANFKIIFADFTAVFRNFTPNRQKDQELRNNQARLKKSIIGRREKNTFCNIWAVNKKLCPKN